MTRPERAAFSTPIYARKLVARARFRRTPPSSCESAAPRVSAAGSTTGKVDAQGGHPFTQGSRSGGPINLPALLRVLKDDQGREALRPILAYLRFTSELSTREDGHGEAEAQAERTGE